MQLLFYFVKIFFKGDWLAGFFISGIWQSEIGEGGIGKEGKNLWGVISKGW